MATAQQHESQWSGNQIDDSVGRILNNTYENPEVVSSIRALQTAVDNITAQSIGAVQQFSTMPQNPSGYTNQIAQYVGATTSTYTQGYFYISNGTQWVPIKTQQDPQIAVDTAVNASSTNPVENKAIKEYVDSAVSNATNAVSNISNLRGKKNGYASLDDNAKVTAEEASAQMVKLEAGVTIQLSHAGKFLLVSRSDNAAATTTITIPANSSQAFPLGTEIEVCRWGTGEVRFQGSNGVSLNSAVKSVSNTGNYIYISSQFGTAGLKKTGTNIWLLTGSLK